MRSHDTIFHLLFPFDAFSIKNGIVATQKSNVESKCRLKIDWRDIAIRHSDENHIVRTIKKSRIGVCEHLTIDLPAHRIVWPDLYGFWYLAFGICKSFFNCRMELTYSTHNSDNANSRSNIPSGKLVSKLSFSSLSIRYNKNRTILNVMYIYITRRFRYSVALTINGTFLTCSCIYGNGTF